MFRCLYRAGRFTRVQDLAQLTARNLDSACLPMDEIPHPSYMPKSVKANTKSGGSGEELKGWKQIAEFLGEPVSVVKRWAAEGMPVHVEGRFVAASPAELNAWLSRESGRPVQVATPQADLTSELKRGIAFFRERKKQSVT